jgi:hypothetical protein
MVAVALAWNSGFAVHTNPAPTSAFVGQRPDGAAIRQIEWRAAPFSGVVLVDSSTISHIV